MPETTRRGFLAGCSAAVASIAGSKYAFAADYSSNDEILVHVYLRGGLDGLALISPIAGPDRDRLRAARPDLTLPTASMLSLDGRFGLHPSAAPLIDFYRDGKMAVVHAAGLPSVPKDREAGERFAERGGEVANGWLERHLTSATDLTTEIYIPAVSLGKNASAALYGSRETLHMEKEADLQSLLDDDEREAMKELYSGNTWMHENGRQALAALEIGDYLSLGADYQPSRGVSYPKGSFGEDLAQAASLIKLDLGLRVAAIEMDGFDIACGQNNASGMFSSLLSKLSRGLKALYRDLEADGLARKLTIVVRSDTGRSLHQNAHGGTDPGHGGVMLVIGDNVVNGVHGDWPGLAEDQLVAGGLEVTTDFRSVLGEVLIRRLGNPRLGYVFPDFVDYSPLGVVSGRHPAPIYS